MSVTGIALIALLGPRIRLFDGLTLKTQITGTASGPLTVQDTLPVRGAAAAGEGASGQPPAEEEDYQGLLGKTGTALSVLRPSGKAEIEGRIYSVEGEGVFIEAGKTIKVIRVRGNMVVVRLV
jgi:membrane-bound serine protease (ClpP class)